MAKTVPIVTFDSTTLNGREAPMVHMLLWLSEQVLVQHWRIGGVEPEDVPRRAICEHVALLMTQRFPDLAFQVEETDETGPLGSPR